MLIGRAARGRDPLSLLLAIGLIASCAPASSPGPTASRDPSSRPSLTASPTATPPVGGTLRVGLPAEGDDGPITDLYIDPHRSFVIDEILRCCLVRTLLSYNGRSTADGGIILRPDLAESLPDVSPDGLTWTFRLRDGLRYGPPFEDTDILARDIIRGIERAIALGDAAGYFESIQGAIDYAEGRAAAVAGLEAPDDRTLVIRLVRPDADIATVLSHTASSPIPAGAADGHDEDYGAFLVASGPYMYEGSEAIAEGGSGPGVDAEQPPGTAVLVRNPSWDRSTDGLRGAWVDRIEVSRSASLDDDRRRFEQGAVDIPGYVLRSDELTALRADPSRRDRVAVATFPGVQFLALNLALPPFDDLHVRRAIAFALDRATLAEILTATAPRFTTYRVARHAIPDSFENNLLLDYDHFGTVGDRGDIAAARAEVMQSAYDDDGDGLCDAAACIDVPLVAGFHDPRIVSTVEDSLSELGISLRQRPGEGGAFVAGDVRAQHGVFAIGGWFSDTPTLGGFTTIFGPPFVDPDGSAFSLSASLIGSTPEQLVEWGYDVESVPSVDAKVNECLAVVGSARFRCAAELDQLVVERVAPYVPIAYPEVGFAFGERVVAYSIDQSVVAPALDQIALAP